MYFILLVHYYSKYSYFFQASDVQDEQWQPIIVCHVSLKQESYLLFQRKPHQQLNVLSNFLPESCWCWFPLKEDAKKVTVLFETLRETLSLVVMVVIPLRCLFFSSIDVLYGQPLLLIERSYFFRHQTFRMNSMTTMTTNNSVSRKVSNKTVTSLASSFNGNHVNSSRAKNCSTHLETPLLSSGEPTPSRNFVWDQCTTARIFLPKEKKKRWKIT